MAGAQASLKNAETRLELLSRGDPNPAADGLCSLTIKSPIDGIIQEVHIAPGQTVTSSTALVSIVGIDPVWIKVPVYVGNLTVIDTEKPARIHSLADAAGAQTQLAPPVGSPFSVDPASATPNLFYELSNKAGSYRPGQKIGATLVLRGAERSLVVPYSSIVYDMYGGVWVCQRSEPHVFVRQRVELLHVLGDLAILSRGPAAGTSVVSAGTAELFGTEFGVGK